MTLAQIETVARRELVGLARFKRGLTLTATVVVPSLFAALSVVPDRVFALGGGQLFWSLFGFLVLVQGTLAWLASSSAELVQEVYFQAREIDEDNRRLRADTSELERTIERLAVQRDQAQAWTVMQRRLRSDRMRTKDQFEQAIDEILAPLVSERDVLFHFDRGELWNFAVYLAVGSGDAVVLRPVWRRKDDRHPASGPGFGREWRPGDGHIGLAYETRTTLITKDASQADVASMMRVPAANRRSYDSVCYRSFASIPIGALRDGEPPTGVLVGTSDRAQRYTSEDDDSVVILVQAAQVLATVIDATQQDFNTWYAGH